MTTLYIFRHGDTIETDNIFVRFLGHKKSDSHDIDIVPKAGEALQKIGEYLKNIPTDANFTSPYGRCINSSNIVSEFSGKKFTADERLRELEKNGEKFSDFSDRVKNFLDWVRQKNYSSVSICTHGAVIGAIKHLETTGKFIFFNVWDYPQPGNLIIIKGGKIETIDFNLHEQ